MKCVKSMKIMSRKCVIMPKNMSRKCENGSNEITKTENRLKYELI